MSEPIFKGEALVNAITRYEAGEMDEDEAREFLTWLYETGVLFSLQGSYQRAYEALCT